MDICAPLIAHIEPSKAVEPGQRALHHPTIPPQPLARLDATASDPWSDAASRATPADSAGSRSPCRHAVSPGVCVVATALARQTQRRNGVDGLVRALRVVHIGARDGHRQWHAVAVHHDVTLCAQLAAIRRILAGLVAPPGAGTLALSSDARVQSIRPASCSRCSRRRCRRLHTPACCQSRKRRQQVMPLPQPSSWGSISHGMPVFKTKTMPVKCGAIGDAAWTTTLGLGWLGRQQGRDDRPTASSLTKVVLMPSIYHTVGFC